MIVILNVYHIAISAVTPCVMTLYNLLGLSATHLECQQHMHVAIDKVMGSGPPQLAHRKKMPYVEATILECLRLTSHYPLALPHKTTRNVDMNGYVIPEGVQVGVSRIGLHKRKPILHYANCILCFGYAQRK